MSGAISQSELDIMGSPQQHGSGAVSPWSVRGRNLSVSSMSSWTLLVHYEPLWTDRGRIRQVDDSGVEFIEFANVEENDGGVVHVEFATSWTGEDGWTRLSMDDV